MIKYSINIFLNEEVILFFQQSISNLNLEFIIVIVVWLNLEFLLHKDALFF
jgi:hypothetical protein